MKLILGLGNPGSQYAETRHNIGFMVVDLMATMFPVRTLQANSLAHLYQATIQNQPVLLIKPQTYMNRSGIAVQRVLYQYAESPENLVVIYDDLDLDVGRLRIRKRGGHGGHKGLQSIIEQLATKEFVRIRMGIGRPAQTEHTDKQMLQEKVVDYVLQPFDQDEQPLIRDSLKRSVEAIKLIVADQLDTAMNLYNRR
jgi:peptidyl-tRNA hydrolase, PTH1 family